MKVLLCPADYSGCGTYRMLWPMEVLQAQEPSIEFEVSQTLPIKHKGSTGEVTGVGDVECDVLVLQRPLHDWMAEAIPHFQRKGIRVVVELDDDFGALHPQNHVYPNCHPSRNPKSNWRHLARAAARADLVTVTTPALAERYGSHGRVMVVPNFVNAMMLDFVHHSDGRTIGWAGTTLNHPTDLQATGGGVQMAIEDTGARFVVIGDGERVEVNLGLREPADVTGYLKMDEYLRALTTLDVGIVPLDDIAFNRGKSALKGLEYAAAGTPFVASPVDDYKRIADAGVGVLAAYRARSWRSAVKTLLTDRALWEETALRGREAVREQFTLQANAWRWAEAWESVLAPA